MMQSHATLSLFVPRTPCLSTVGLSMPWPFGFDACYGVRAFQPQEGCLVRETHLAILFWEPGRNQASYHFCAAFALPSQPRPGSLFVPPQQPGYVSLSPAQPCPNCDLLLRVLLVHPQPPNCSPMPQLRLRSNYALRVRVKLPPRLSLLVALERPALRSVDLNLRPASVRLAIPAARAASG